MSERHPNTGPVGTGSRPAEFAPTTQWMSLFPSLSPALSPQVPTPLDTVGGPAELVALNGALASPDLFLIDAGSGNDQLTLAFDIAFAARRMGKRILLLTAEPIDADKLIVRFRDAGETSLLRGLAAGEPANQVPQASAERLARVHGEQAVACVRNRLQQKQHEAKDRLTKLEAVQGIWPSTHSAETRLPLAKAELEPLIDPLELPARLAQGIHEETDLLRQLSVIEAELLTLDQEAQAKKSSGFLGGLKRLFAEDTTPQRRTALETQRLDLNRALIPVRKEREELNASITTHEAKRNARRVELESEITSLESQLASSLPTVTSAGFSTLPTTAELITALQTTHSEVCEAEQTLRELDAEHADLVRRLLAAVRLVVAPLKALRADVALSGDATFDQVIVTDAELLTPADLPRIESISTRRVLLGDAPTRQTTRHAAKITVFQELFERHHVPSLRMDAGRLIASLLPVPHGTPLRCEPLADNPATELRFLEQTADLAEIAFPAHTKSVTAKEFLASELGNYLLRFPEPFVASWTETETHIIARAPTLDAMLLNTGDATANLGDGITEQVHGCEADCWTVAVNFDKSAGWTLDTAQAKLQEIGLPPPLRTVRMPRPLFITERAPNRRVAVGAS